MKIIILLALVSVAAAANLAANIRQNDEPLQYFDARDDSAQFSLRYLTKDGTDVTKQGSLKPNAKGDDYVLHQTGRVSYFDPEGNKHEYKYLADDTGFHVDPEVLPKPVAPLPPTF